MSFLLSLVEIVIDALDLGVVVLALSLLESDSVSESINLILISGLLLSVLSEFIMEVVSIFSESVSLITLDTDLSLESYALLLPPADLVPDGSYLSLVLVVSPILFIEEESHVFDLLSE